MGEGSTHENCIMFCYVLYNKLLFILQKQYDIFSLFFVSKVESTFYHKIITTI